MKTLNKQIREAIKRGNDVLENHFKNYAEYFISMKDKRIDLPATKPNRAVTFQEALKSTLILGQVFALIPVDGVLSSSPGQVKFKIYSLKSIYTLLALCGQMFITTMAINKIVFVKNTWQSSTSIIFFATAFATTIMFFRIAANWPKLVRRISKIEELDPNFDQGLKLRMNITCFVLVFFALVEHILSMLPSIIHARSCYPQIPITSYEEFMRYFFAWIFDYFAYTPVAAITAQYLQVQTTFTWNFSDLFVISMSFYLTSRLRQVNKKLLAARGKILPESFWRGAREEYCRAAQAVRRVDDVIGGIVFITFANNLYFVCIQLFNSLESGISGKLSCGSRVSSSNTVVGYVTSAYYLFSLICLITRSVAVSLIAAQVNSASTVPAAVLYEVPSDGYCTEVERFINQVNGDKVALTGLQFFSITRGLLLTVAATIVTYELVMFQFNSSPPAVTQPTTLAAILLNVTTVAP